MEFEARQLKSYAEPVSVDSLSIGEVYFNVLFLDDDILIPITQPVVFVGKNLASGDTDSLYFQDAESYRERRTCGKHPDRGDVMYIRLPDEAGAWWKANGDFIGFLEAYAKQ